ncbi:CGNR zinc finger domain-containing protein [Micromonospora sp. WMMD882]|uniref:CGNR zinc finger domain-containing protein n=1 Tax=Micromonospora sp. WMMD882 TaxID=3015151 RepID=UPI00248CCBA7|nr:CGNR zinc finger domain-containing protein [Micromonospora sp. WMMD882]WBB78045.1 CGNR zinc finger domain-containing protein [Micromonospora sp. WMMD882]
MKRQEAPGQLEVVRSFLNTLDLELRVDRLDTTHGLADWLAGQLPDLGVDPPSEQDRRSVVALRDALRAVLADTPAHDGGPGTSSGPGTSGGPGGSASGTGAVDALDRLIAGLPLRLSFAGTMTPRLGSTRRGVDAVLARLLEIVMVATIDGAWARLKMCPADDCRWVFYDNARNRMGVWCQMTECGNRRKVREHRSRRRSAPTG